MFKVKTQRISGLVNKTLKNVLNLIKKYWVTANVLTLLVALATFWLGFETRQLKFVDLGPHISIGDVDLQSIDNTGSIIKDRSWLKGEQFNPNASPNKIEGLLLTIKFSNSGRRAGYVELLNYREILESVQSQRTSSESIVGGRLLVPGEGETGWSYVADIVKMLDYTITKIDYKFAAYDINGKKVEQSTVTIVCEFPKVRRTVNAGCKPVSFLQEKNLLVNVYNSRLVENFY